jgi:predicted HicB family RNase H-like nuclease
MAYSQAQNKATQKYQKKAYDQIAIRIPKGKRELYNKYAADHGMSLASYICQLIENDNK